ncbi:uncharacterized protein [Amphiura filiformis]|uniref:uncharacterized protein n=1 Tax=Amphiura filiformis TaxID=82378 RepID=UPI003B211AFD
MSFTKLLTMDVLVFFVGIFVITIKGTYIENYRYLGCYIESPSNRAVPDNQLIDGQTLTITSCISHCQSYGSRYAGLQKGNKCFCGSDGVSYDMHGQASESDCNDECTGDSSQTCGGINRNSVFDIWDQLTTSSSPAGSSTQAISTTEYVSTTASTTEQQTPTMTTLAIQQASTTTDQLTTSSSPAGSSTQEISTTEYTSTTASTTEQQTPTIQQASTTHTTTELLTTSNNNGEFKRHAGFIKFAERQCVGMIDTVIQIRTARSKRDCARFCLRNTTCNSFDFVTQDDSTYVCRLQESTADAALLNEEGCDFYVES